MRRLVRGGGVRALLLLGRRRALLLHHLRLQGEEEDETHALDTEGRHRQRVAGAVTGIAVGKEALIAVGGVIEGSDDSKRHDGAAKREDGEQRHDRLDVRAADLQPRRAEDEEEEEESDHDERLRCLKAPAHCRAGLDHRVVNAHRVVRVPAVVAHTPQRVAWAVVIDTGMIRVACRP